MEIYLPVDVSRTTQLSEPWLVTMELLGVLTGQGGELTESNTGVSS